MNKIYYKVGANGYYTRCNTYAEMLKQKALNPNYTFEVCMEQIEEKKPGISPLRAELLKKLGRVVAIR